MTTPKTSIDDFNDEDQPAPKGEPSPPTGDAQAAENRDRESPS